MPSPRAGTPEENCVRGSPMLIDRALPRRASRARAQPGERRSATRARAQARAAERSPSPRPELFACDSNCCSAREPRIPSAQAQSRRSVRRPPALVTSSSARQRILRNGAASEKSARFARCRRAAGCHTLGDDERHFEDIDRIQTQALPVEGCLGTDVRGSISRLSACTIRPRDFGSSAARSGLRAVREATLFRT